MKNLMKWMSAVALVAIILAAFALPVQGAMNYVGGEDVITWSNSTGSAVASGDLLDLNGRMGVAMTDIGNTTSGAVRTEGLWLYYVTTNAYVFGQPLYRASATSVTHVAGAAGAYAGIAADSKAGNTNTLLDRKVVLWLNAPLAGSTTNFTVQLGNGTTSTVQIVAGVITNRPVTEAQ